MRRILPWAFMLALALAPIGVSSPIDGSWSVPKRVEVVSGQPWKISKTFRGGERASVLVIGDHEAEIPNLRVTVSDKNGQLVAEDKGTSPASGDIVGVIWYPPRTGEYQIEVSNPSKSVSKCYISIK